MPPAAARLRPAVVRPPAARPSQQSSALYFQIPAPPPSLDPYTQASYLCSYLNSLTYSKLFRFAAGTPDVSPGDITQEPDLAQFLPEIADELTFVVTLKPANWHDMPPVFGRPVTSE